jgi:uncharacterized protein YecE (DUF72 family)
VTIRVGVAGWSYPDWRGIVHPPGCRDTLRFCAGLVDCLEINSTFYGLPRARVTEAWVRRVADLPGFSFTAKVPGQFTHERQLAPAELAAARDGFVPLASAGRLHALLLQFAQSFPWNQKSRDHLLRLVDEFRALAPLVVEVRHRSWLDPAAREWLAGLGVSVANLDYPGMASGFGGGVVGIDGPTSLAYFRLHGRNQEAWFRRGAGRDAVYDHEYSEGEVRELESRLQAIAAGARQTIVIANNHFHGKGMKVALELLAWLRGGPVRVPEELQRAYPSLRAIASGSQRGLFEG